MAGPCESFGTENTRPESYPGYWVTRVEYREDGEIKAFHIQVSKEETVRVARGEFVEYLVPWLSKHERKRFGLVTQLTPPVPKDDFCVHITEELGIPAHRAKISELLLRK